MACYHPLKAFYLKDKSGAVAHTENGKNLLYITDYKVKYVYMDKKGDWHKSYDEYTFQHSFEYEISDEFVQIPCGKCIGCRLDQSKMWSQRCMLEAQYHTSNYFLTITYDDEHLPTTSYTDKQTGEIFEANTLVKRDWQLFVKALRSQLQRDGKPPVRFYMCGEYGTTTARPHYHAIMFGLELDDLVFYKRTGIGQNLYNSKYLDNIWKKGYIVVGSVTPESCGYVARYCTKKAYQNNDVFIDRNMTPEFTLMSRRPGIASNYYFDNPNLFDYEYINLATLDGGINFRPPRYFQKLAEKEDENFFLDDQIYSEDNHISEDYRRSLLGLTDLDYLTYLENAERVKERQIKSLQRTL